MQVVCTKNALRENNKLLLISVTRDPFSWGYSKHSTESPDSIASEVKVDSSSHSQSGPFGKGASTKQVHERKVMASTSYLIEQSISGWNLK